LIILSSAEAERAAFRELQQWKKDRSAQRDAPDRMKGENVMPFLPSRGRQMAPGQNALTATAWARDDSFLSMLASARVGVHS
jgi:hypothetical protein